MTPEQAVIMLTDIVGDRPCYLVGGYLRDALLGREHKDIDIACAAPREIGEQIAHALHRRLITIDERWSFFRVPVDRLTVDVALLRGRTLEEDLRQRDFTINALGAQLQDYAARGLAAVVDPTGGRADLAAGLIRPAYPQAFADDPLRLLRVFRFAATLGFAPAPGVEEQVREQATSIAPVARERIRDELFGILGTPVAAQQLARMGEQGLVQQIIPQLAALFGQPQNYYHHLDVWHHSLETMRELETLLADAELLGPECHAALGHALAREGPHGYTRLQLLRLACLLHDVGKPQTASRDEQGVIHFYGHAQASEQIAREIALELRLSRGQVRALATLAAMHLQPLELLKTGNWRGRAGMRLLHRAGALSPMLLTLSLADHLASRGPATTSEELASHLAMTRFLLTRFLCPGERVTPLPVDGDGLMARYGLTPGPSVGRLLVELRLAHAERPFASEREVWDYVESQHPELLPR